MLSAIWNSEPILVTLVGSAAFWPALFFLLRAFGLPLTHDQQDALAGFGVLVGTLVARSRVSPVTKDTPK